MRLLIALVLLIPLTTAHHLSVNEEQYGENLVRIRRQAEVDWVRDNTYIIYDTMSRRNYYVSQIRDDEIAHILRNVFSREKVGVHEADLTGYMEKARENMYGNEENEAKPQRTVVPKARVNDSRYGCIRRNAFTIYDPIRRANRWVSSLSDQDLSRILTRNRFLNPSVLRCF